MKKKIEEASHKFYKGEEQGRSQLRDAFVQGAMWAQRQGGGAWVSVEESLPEYDEIVIVRAVRTLGIYKGEEHIAVDVRKEQSKNYQLDKHGFGLGSIIPFGAEITHWMPIPEIE